MALAMASGRVCGTGGSGPSNVVFQYQVFSGNYGGQVPNFTPSTATAIAIDTSNGAQWDWYNGSWH